MSFQQLKIVAFAITLADRERRRMSVPLYKQLNGKIDLKQLRHAVAAADYGSFRQAAEALNIKQSTLSRSILQLEHATSIRLFERSPGGVAVSHLGGDFIRMANGTSDVSQRADVRAARCYVSNVPVGDLNGYRSYVTHPLWKATDRHPQTSSCRRVIRRGEASAHDPNSLKTRPSNDALLLRLEGPRNR
jgi:hypothetical protein